MTAVKEPVKLRMRSVSHGRTSLYLDIYHNGYRRYEFLRMYLIPERTREDKQKNRQTLDFAEAVRAKRVVQLRNQEYGFADESRGDVRFFDYYEALVEKQGGRSGCPSWDSWMSTLRQLRIYEPNKRITFRSITPQWIEGFKNYLERRATTGSGDRKKPLSNNTRVTYFSRFRTCINRAVADGIIASSPLRGIKPIRGEEGTRMYLTLDEIRMLVKTPCEYPNIRNAFLFSCLTGLRRSDVQRLRWGDVQQQGDFTRIIFKQKKTKGQEYLDITSQARELMGERGRADELVFRDIHTPSCCNNTIKRWVLRAGIDKDITFHCARHSFAVMMLDLGTDIYTVSKLLGHRELATTQIYAKVLDKNKQAAVERIPDVLGQ